MTFLECDTFNIQKRGLNEEEYEDYYCVGAHSPDEYRFAVADGATESSFSGLWAELLAEGYLKDIPVKSLAENWADRIDKLDLPWYARAKADEGAWAAFMGMTLYVENQTYEVISQGDCNLFQLRKGKVVEAFPIEHSADFNNSPMLIGSREPLKEIESRFTFKKGKWSSGDTIYMMTDALAAWFARGLESSQSVEEIVVTIKNQEEFENLVEKLRESKDSDNMPELKNDDVTLIRIKLN